MNHEIIGSTLKLPDGTVLPLSKATKAGDFLYLSGQLGIDENFILATGIVNQTRLCIQNMAQVLRLADLGLENIIKTTVWLTDVQNFADFNQCYAQEFPKEAPPARSTVCSALAIPGALIEIEAIAYAG